MKIAVIGYSGAGKSTLAEKLGEALRVDVLHFDTVQFLPGWAVRDDAEKRKITEAFLDSHDSWVIDGNYTKLFYERRMAEADRIVLLLFNRWSCLSRAVRRYRAYRHTTRPDMADGCEEKLDAEFLRWILFGQRKRKTRERFRRLREQYPDKVLVAKNQKQLDACFAALTRQAWSPTGELGDRPGDQVLRLDGVAGSRDGIPELFHVRVGVFHAASDRVADRVADLPHAFSLPQCDRFQRVLCLLPGAF